MKVIIIAWWNSSSILRYPKDEECGNGKLHNHLFRIIYAYILRMMTSRVKQMIDNQLYFSLIIQFIKYITTPLLVLVNLHTSLHQLNTTYHVTYVNTLHFWLFRKSPPFPVKVKWKLTNYIYNHADCLIIIISD